MYYILKDRKAIPADLEAWAAWREESRRTGAFLVARDAVEGDVFVSTVFLGLDHGIGGVPLLFETMIFGGERGDEQWRYATWEEAEAGHKRVVEELS